MNKTIAPIDLGKEMWMMLCPTQVDVVRINGFTTQEQKAQVWAGFLGGVASAMAVDLGTDAKVVYGAVGAALDELIAERSKPLLKLVPT